MGVRRFATGGAHRASSGSQTQPLRRGPPFEPHKLALNRRGRDRGRADTAWCSPSLSPTLVGVRSGARVCTGSTQDPLPPSVAATSAHRLGGGDRPVRSAATCGMMVGRNEPDAVLDGRSDARYSCQSTIAGRRRRLATGRPGACRVPRQPKACRAALCDFATGQTRRHGGIISTGDQSSKKTEARRGIVARHRDRSNSKIRREKGDVS